MTTNKIMNNEFDSSKEVLTKDDLTEYSTDYKIPEDTESEIQKAEEMYYRKRKMFYIETVAIIVLMLLYVLFKSIVTN